MVVIILMGVSGAGKTTVGRLLAQDLGWSFYEGDDFHPQANVTKMAQGLPLTDADRDQWLTTLRHLMGDLISQGHSAVIACSALKQAYRDRLLLDPQQVRFIYLKGDYTLIHRRLEERPGHFMKAGLLSSQFETLEEPVGVPTFDVSQKPETIVSQIKRELRPGHQV